MAEVTDNTVYLSGDSRNLSNEWVTIQTSQSPWKFHGHYDGFIRDLCRRIDNAMPQDYRIRLVHKPSGPSIQRENHSGGREEIGVRERLLPEVCS